MFFKLQPHRQETYTIGGVSLKIDQEREIARDTPIAVTLRTPNEKDRKKSNIVINALLKALHEKNIRFVPVEHCGNLVLTISGKDKKRTGEIFKAAQELSRQYKYNFEGLEVYAKAKSPGTSESAPVAEDILPSEHAVTIEIAGQKVVIDTNERNNTIHVTSNHLNIHKLLEWQLAEAHNLWPNVFMALDNKNPFLQYKQRQGLPTQDTITTAIRAIASQHPTMESVTTRLQEIERTQALRLTGVRDQLAARDLEKAKQETGLIYAAVAEHLLKWSNANPELARQLTAAMVEEMQDVIAQAYLDQQNRRGGPTR